MCTKGVKNVQSMADIYNNFLIKNADSSTVQKNHRS